jgi:hypothetical protein
MPIPPKQIEHSGTYPHLDLPNHWKRNTLLDYAHISNKKTIKMWNKRGVLDSW